MFWFARPDEIDDSVIEFLNFERNYLTAGWNLDKIFVVTAVIHFFIFLIYTTWKWLLVVIIISAILKVIHSVIFGGSSGYLIIKPAILGIIICTLVIWGFFRKNNK